MPEIHCRHLQHTIWENIATIPAISREALMIYKVSHPQKEQSPANHFVIDNSLAPHSFQLCNNSQKSAPILRWLLSALTQIPLKEIEIECNKFGKPTLKNKTEPPIHFNIAHSGDLSIFAFSRSPVGIDMEMLNPELDIIGIIADYFSPEEQHFIHSTTNQAQESFKIWTRKEALLKAIGIGVTEEMKHITCLDNSNLGREEVIQSSVNWTVTSFDINAGYSGAVAHTPHIKNIVFYDLTSSLREFHGFPAQ